MDEIWKPVTIKEYNDCYEVSNFGRVRSTRRGIILKPSITNRGYLRVVLCKCMKTKSMLVHRLVALAFVENDNPKFKKLVNHKDEDKKNNRSDNLEWCNATYNSNYGTVIQRRIETKNQLLNRCEFNSNRASTEPLAI